MWRNQFNATMLNHCFALLVVQLGPKLLLLLLLLQTKFVMRIEGTAETPP